MNDLKSNIEKPAQWQVLAELELEPGGDHEGQANEAIATITAAVRSLTMPQAHLERMQAAVLQTCLRAMERAAVQMQPQPVVLRALASQMLDASQGWGFFLIERRVDGQAAKAPGNGHGGETVVETCAMIELYLYREGDRRQQKRELPAV